MRKYGKRWLCGLLVLSLCLSLFSVTALAEDEPQPAADPAAAAEPLDAPAPETNGEPAAPAGEDAPEDDYEKVEGETTTTTKEPVTPPDNLYPDVTVDLKPGEKKTEKVQPDGKKLLPEGVSADDVEWIYATDEDGNEITDANGNKIITGYTRKTESVTEPSPDVPEELPAGGNTTEDEGGSSYTFVVLPDAPQSGTTTNEDGTTTETTVEPIYGEEGAFAGLVIGYRSTTTVTDKDGNKLSSASDAVWGTKVTVKTTETVDEAANKKTTTTTTTEVFTRGVTETTETVTATPRQLTASMSTVKDTSSVEELYKKMIGPDEKYQKDKEDGKTWGSRWYGISGDRSFQNTNKNISNPAKGKYRYTGGNGLIPGFNIGVTREIYIPSTGQIMLVNTSTQTPQLELMDEYGNKFYVYCIDQSVTAQMEAGFDYDILNIEDAEYLTPAQREHISAIVRYGFWGTLGETENDAPVGSLNAIYTLIDRVLERNPTEAGLQDALKWFKDHPRYAYTDYYYEQLGPGIALAATQAALWMYGDSGKDGVTGTTSSGITGDEQKTYFYLMQLLASDCLVDIMKEDQEQRTESRILNPHDLSASLTVRGPQRDDGSYLTDLTFDLNGSVNDGDDLVLKLKVGDEEKTIRISGAQKEGEIAAVKGESGYTIPEIALFPSSELTLSLSGTQQIERGVYIFQHDNDYGKTQTLVGLMETGTKKDVNLTTTLKFNVTEVAKRTTETVSWLESRTETTTKTHEETLPQPETPETPKTPEEPKEPETPETPETPEAPETPVTPVVPGYDVPKTGDASGLYYVLAILSALGLALVTCTGRKRRTA